MVKIDNLKSRDKGRGVFYKDHAGKRTYGLIKSWNDKWIFVVYHCDDDWDNYTDYTGAATKGIDLEFSDYKDWDFVTRFDLIDFD